MPSASSRRSPEGEGGFHRLADLVIDAAGAQRQRVAAVVGADIEADIGKIGADQVDDPVGGFALVGADGDEPRLADAGRFQTSLRMPRTEIDAEAESLRRADALGRGIDDRHVGAARQQHLRAYLPEAREADHQHLGAGAGEILVQLSSSPFVSTHQAGGRDRSVSGVSTIDSVTMATSNEAVALGDEPPRRGRGEQHEAELAALGSSAATRTRRCGGLAEGARQADR